MCVCVCGNKTIAFNLYISDSIYTYFYNVVIYFQIVVAATDFIIFIVYIHSQISII